MISYSRLTESQPDQLRQILALYRQTGWWDGDGDDTATVKGIITGSHCFVVATDGGNVVGMGRAISDRISDAYIQDVTVAENFRASGVGSEIIRRLIACLETDGIEWIGLIAERNSHDFYRPFGFNVMENAAPMLRLKK